VIAVSLVAASVVLPFLLRGLTMPAEASKQAEEDEARVAAAKPQFAGSSVPSIRWQKGAPTPTPTLPPARA
jgi:hypothetical protein